MLETEKVHSNLSVWPKMNRMCMRSSLIIKGLVPNAAVLMDRLGPVRGKEVFFSTCDHTELVLRVLTVWMMHM